MKEANFDCYKANVQALTCWTSIKDDDLRQYELMKRLDVVFPQDKFQWRALEALCEDENHPLESITALLAPDDEGKVWNCRAIEQRLFNAANKGLKRLSATRALVLPESTSHANYANAFCHFLGLSTGHETREIVFSANILDLVGANDRSRVLQCLSNLKGITSITLEYLRGNALTSVLEALAASPAAKSIQTFNLIRERETTIPNIDNNALQVESVCALQKLLESASSSLLALKMSGFTWRLQNLAPLAAGLETCRASLLLLDMSNSLLLQDCAWVLHRFFQETNSLQHLIFAEAQFESQDTIVSLIMGISRNSSLESLDLGDLDNLSQLYQGVAFGMAIRNLLASNCRLRGLRLDNNLDIGHENLEKIAEGAAESRGLEELALESCGIDNDGVAMLIAALFSNMQNGGFFGSKPSMLTLGLSGNSVGQQGALAISSFLAEPSCFLQQLALDRCEIDDEAMLALLPGLTTNRSLLYLSLSENENVTVQVWKKFAAIIPKLQYLERLYIDCSAPRMAQENDSDTEMIHRYPTFAQIKLLYKSFLNALEKNRSITDNSIDFGIGDDVFSAKASFIAQRNRALPHLPQVSSHDRGGMGLWPHILSKLLGKSWGSHDGPSLAFHLMSTRPEALFSRHNVASPVAKRQKRDSTGLSMAGLTETLPTGY